MLGGNAGWKRTMITVIIGVVRRTKHARNKKV